MTLTDALIIVAIVLGPVIAVGVGRRLDRQRETRDRQLEVFRTLMATRAHAGSADHVHALNRIDVEFSATRPSEAAVLDAWRHYAGVMARTDLSAEEWDAGRRAAITDLLMRMAAALGYELDRDHIERSAAARAPVATSTDIL